MLSFSTITFRIRPLASLQLTSLPSLDGSENDFMISTFGAVPFMFWRKRSPMDANYLAGNLAPSEHQSTWVSLPSTPALFPWSSIHQRAILHRNTMWYLTIGTPPLPQPPAIFQTLILHNGPSCLAIPSTSTWATTTSPPIRSFPTMNSTPKYKTYILIGSLPSLQLLNSTIQQLLCLSHLQQHYRRFPPPLLRPPSYQRGSPHRLHLQRRLFKRPTPPSPLSTSHAVAEGGRCLRQNSNQGNDLASVATDFTCSSPNCFNEGASPNCLNEGASTSSSSCASPATQFGS